MCGIQGINEGDQSLISAMNEALAYRGPDDRGLFTDERVALGHNRLSILDLSPRGHQPMANQDGNLQIVFNGEIYNFKELKQELADYSFTSDTDTEVILAGYAREGTAFFNKLRGMWALALYDVTAGKLVLSRDPFGIKPLYYFLKDGRFAFSSELRGLRPVLQKYGYSDDPLAHRLYFTLGYMPAPYTPFTEVRKLLPGEVSEFDLKGRVLRGVETLLPYTNTTLSVEAALEDSVHAHFVADVPVGLFYSGGIDSTLLLAKARALGYTPEPFFLHIPNRLDNEYALAAAQELGVKLTIFEWSDAQARELLLRIRTQIDEPFADTSFLPVEYLSQQVSRTHKVVLSGEGGDEFFGGYHRHNHLLGLQGGMRLVPEALIGTLPTRLRRAIEAKVNRDPSAVYLEFVRVDEGLAPRAEALAHIRSRTQKRYDDLALAFDQNLYLPDDLLFKIDRAGMRHGLEGRVPFLDKVFFGAARALPAERRHGGRTTGKGMLKTILREYLPERLVERPKQGFSTPLSMLKDIPQEICDAALREAKEHPSLMPFDPLQAMRHPQTRYAFLMWAGWREGFF